VKPDLDRIPSTPARWIAATICILYGFAKLNGSQFTVLDSQLTKPLGEVSGFWLTWHYFGYSTTYGTMLALIQIAGGILLVVPRTALAAALLLLPVAANIVLIDVFYGVDFGGTFAAIILLSCLCVVVAPFVPRLRSAFLLTTLPARPRTSAIVVLSAILIGAFAFTWWVANSNNRFPTSIDGVWSVVSQTDGRAAKRRWQFVFFEYNRAYMAVFRATDGPDETHHFEIDSTGTVRVWERWLTKGQLIMEGRLTSLGEIQMETKDADSSGRLVLRRIRSTP